MSLKRYLLLFIFCFYVNSVSVEAFETKQKNLFLRAYVSPSISLHLTKSKLGPNQTLWLLFSETNLEHPVEGQKFEVEGIDEKTMNAEVQKIVNTGPKIQYEIIIKELSHKPTILKPIFLKISAN